MPVADQAAQQVRSAQEGRILGRRTAQYEVVTATGAGMAPIDHELLGGQAGLPGLFVEEFGAFYQLVPGGGRLYVDLDDTGVWRDPEIAQTCIRWRLVAFQQHRAMQLFGGGLNGSHQLQVILDALQRRHKQVQAAFPCFGAQRGTGQPVGGLVDLGHTLVVRGRLAMAAQLRRSGKLGLVLVRVGGVYERILSRRHPGLGSQGQPVTQRRITRHQPAMVVAQVPTPTLPAVIGRSTCQRQHLADDFIQALAEHFAQALTLQVVAQARVLGGDVLGQRPFAPQVVEIVLERREHKARRQFQAFGDAGQETPGHHPVGTVVLLLIGDQRAVVPDRHAIAAPITVERPTW